MSVRTVMQTSVATCRPEDDLSTAASRMWEQDCGIVPVVDDAGRVIGLVTDRDACMAAWSQGKKLGEIAVESAMARIVQVVRAGDSIEDAHAVMRRAQVRRVPVVDDDGRLVGLVSIADLARRSAEGEDTTFEEVGRTLAAIVRPAHPAARFEGDTVDTSRGLPARLRAQLDELRTLRDTIRVRLHLAGLDVRDSFRELEPTIERLESEISGATEDAAGKLLASVDRIKRSLRAIGEKAGVRS